MNTTDTSSVDSKGKPLPPLEDFVLRYADQVGGGYDEIEPQVYDLLVNDQLLRVSFDPEALHEHPAAQLAMVGSPLLNSMLDSAANRGATSIAYVHGLNLHPHDLPARLRRTYILPAKTTLSIGRIRPMHHPQCVCWFEFTFESDQREQELLHVAIDLASGRQVRQTDRLLDSNRLGGQPQEAMPIARTRPVREGCLLAAQQAVRTAQALANIRRRELTERFATLSARMSGYYDQMLRELADRAARDMADKQKLESRRVAIEQERGLRLAEAGRKHSLQVTMRPVNLLLVFVPKIELSVVWIGSRGKLPIFRPVFDPLQDIFEPIDCPACQRPTLELRLGALDRVHCPRCG